MEVQAIINLYKTCGFNISRVEANQEFSCITNDLLSTPLNDVADADDHIPEVEWSIGIIKEHVMCTVQGLPFQRIPKLMMMAVVDGAHKALNHFLVSHSVSDVMSLR